MVQMYFSISNLTHTHTHTHTHTRKEIKKTVNTMACFYLYWRLKKIGNIKHKNIAISHSPPAYVYIYGIAARGSYAINILMKTKIETNLNRKSDSYHIVRLKAMLLSYLSNDFSKKLCFTLNWWILSKFCLLRSIKCQN